MSFSARKLTQYYILAKTVNSLLRPQTFLFLGFLYSISFIILTNQLTRTDLCLVT